MIIKAPIAPQSIITFRLVTGETLMARMVEFTAEKLTIIKPVVANPTQTEQGYGIYYTPFCATADEDEQHRIPRAALILEPMVPRDELKAAYVKMTTSLDIPG